MPDRDLAEYDALRATIRERGSVRMWLILAGILGWGALAIGLWAAEVQGALTLVPFLAVAATFEISFFIYIGVERVGRYLQVYHEEDGQGWEHIVMAYGKNFPGGADPLFIPLFSAVAIVNFLGSLAAATRRPGWIVVSLFAHLILGWRFLTARRLAATERALDLERFASLRKNASSSPTSN
jgi:hypothetical protein